jgi:hypothetical protein
MVQVPNIIAKSLSTCRRRELPILMAILEANMEAGIKKWKTRGSRGLVVAWTKLVGKEVQVFRYRVVRIHYDTIYFAHD